MRVSGFERKQRRSAATRLRAGLRRHGVIPCPPALRDLLRASDVRFTAATAWSSSARPQRADAMLSAIRGAAPRHLSPHLRADEMASASCAHWSRRARASKSGCSSTAWARSARAALAELRAAGATRWPSTRWADLAALAPRRRDHCKIDRRRRAGLHGRPQRRRRVPPGRRRRRAAPARRDEHLRIRVRRCAARRGLSRGWFRATRRPPASMLRRDRDQRVGGSCSPTVPPTTAGACATC
jgi:hypothetical protein